MAGSDLSVSAAARSGGWAHREQVGRKQEKRPDVPARRDLVVVQPAKPQERGPISSRRVSAAFLAHLIATARQMPQTRERRRAEPPEAMQHYAAATAASSFAGHALRQTM